MDIKECKHYSAKKYTGKIRKIVDSQIDNFLKLKT